MPTKSGAAAEADVEKPGTKVTRTQWLDLSSLEMPDLIGKNVLIVDEVDDTRTTLEYAVRELAKDVEEARKRVGRGDDETAKTTFSIFVLHVRLLRFACLGAVRLTIETEQGQDQARPPASRGPRRPVSAGCHCARLVDLLSLGSHVRLAHVGEVRPGQANTSNRDIDEHDKQASLQGPDKKATLIA